MIILVIITVVLCVLLAYNVLLIVVFAALAVFVSVARPYASRRPPPVPDCSEMTFQRGLQMFWWNQIGFTYGSNHGPRFGRIVSASLLVLSWAFTPGSLAIQFYCFRRPWVRYYFSPDDDAVLAVSGRRDCWYIGEHLSPLPGKGKGELLRDILLPVLSAYADEHHLIITTTAAAPKLAEGYAKALPGLNDVGRGFPRGRKMRREPTREIQLPNDTVRRQHDS